MSAPTANPSRFPLDAAGGDPTSNMEVHDSTGQLRIHGTADLKLALIVRRPLELAAFSSLFRQLPGVSLVVAESHMAEGVDECLLLRPKAVILDATYPGFASFKAAQRLAESGRIQRIAFLDNALAVCRASRALSVPGAIYFTRDDHPQEVIEYLRLDATKRRAAIARQFSSPTLIANEFRLRQLDEAGVLRLSRCEQTVLSHLASGQPLREIAKALDRADSTIENHKSRLMKKLGVHRSVDLANLAMRTGLVE